MLLLPAHSTPKLLDLFCGAGGAARGYRRAGWHVTGVDIADQPRYAGDRFVRWDALDYLARHWREYDAFHASPPCQGYANSVHSTDSIYVHYSRGKATPRLIGEVRTLLLFTGRPYVIENVSGSQPDLRASLMLCGSMFGDYPARHRFFETSHMIPQPMHTSCRGHNKRLAVSLGVEDRDIVVAGKSRRRGSLDIWRELLGVEWMLTGREMVEAIPPYFTQYVGTWLLRALYS